MKMMSERRKFPVQQEEVLEAMFQRRAKGKTVSTIFLRNVMKQKCMAAMPPGSDPTKDKFGSRWVRKFMKRKGLSVRKKTNFKKLSIWDRLHKVHNYHHFAIYRMAHEPISSESECSSEESESEEVIKNFGSDASDDGEDNSSEETSDSDESALYIMF